MNLTLLNKKIDTFHCEIDNAYGVIACIRAAAKNINDEAFNCFSAELYSIEHYLILLVDILDKETSEFNKPIDMLNMQRFYKYLQRVLAVFRENVTDAPVDKDKTFLYKRSVAAAFAAYAIVENMVSEFANIMEAE